MFNNYTLNLIFSNSRIGRLQHLGLFSFYMFIMGISAFLASEIAQVSLFLGELFLISGLVLPLIAGMIVKVRRLNDFGFSGWSLLLALLPAIGELWMLAIFIVPGSKLSNEYGDPPSPARKSDIWRILSGPIIFLIIICFARAGFFT